MSAIRVLQVIGQMNRGGAEAMIMNLYRNVNREKVQFDFVEHTNSECAFDEEIKSLGGKIYNCPRYTGKNHFQYVNWWKNFFREHPEYKIIHGHIGSTAAMYLKVAKKAGLFTIAHSHSSGTDYSLKSFFYKMMSYPTRYIADFFFACSQVAGVDRFGEKAVNSSNYHVLNNAVDTTKFAFDSEIRENIRKELGYQDNQLVIGHVGRHSGEKNLEFILSVFRIIYQKDQSARLLLVGDGVLHTQLIESAERMGLSSAVIFTGVRSDVAYLLQAMDVFVFPSLYEGLPVTLVETQTSGLPCVISDKVPQECIITDGLVTVKNLTDSAEDWANHILSRANENVRTSRCDEIKAHGYDIEETAKWLEEFYCEHYSK